MLQAAKDHTWLHAPARSPRIACAADAGDFVTRHSLPLPQTLNTLSSCIACAADTGDNGYCLGVEAILNYKFRDKSLLLEALTHTSWPDSSQQVLSCTYTYAGADPWSHI